MLMSAMEDLPTSTAEHDFVAGRASGTSGAGAFDSGEDGEPSGGGAAGWRSPEHHRRRDQAAGGGGPWRDRATGGEEDGGEAPEHH